MLGRVSGFVGKAIKLRGLIFSARIISPRDFDTGRILCLKTIRLTEVILCVRLTRPNLANLLYF